MRERLPMHLMSVKQLRYALEQLNNQDRGLTFEGVGGRRVESWHVDEERNLVVLTLEEAVD